jgi:hypothetical protein
VHDARPETRPRPPEDDKFSFAPRRNQARAKRAQTRVYMAKHLETVDDYVLQRPAYLRRLNRLAKAQAQARRTHPDADTGGPKPKPKPKPKETADDVVAPFQASATPVPWQESMTKALKSGPGRVIDKCLKKEWKHSAERKLLWGCDNNDNDIDLVEYQKPIEESIRKVLPVTRIGEAF